MPHLEASDLAAVCRKPSRRPSTWPRTLAKNNAHFRRALRRLPLGVSSNFRYWGDDKTLYVKRGRGARVWDLDDNEYVDYRLGYGPVILGHCHPEVDAAAREGQQVGTVFALSTEREAVVAELIAEMVRGGRAGALLELGHRGRHGRAAHRARGHRAATATSSSRARTTACSTR